MTHKKSGRVIRVRVYPQYPLLVVKGDRIRAILGMREQKLRPNVTVCAARPRILHMHVKAVDNYPKQKAHDSPEKLFQLIINTFVQSYDCTIMLIKIKTLSHI